MMFYCRVDTFDDFSSDFFLLTLFAEVGPLDVISSVKHGVSNTGLRRINNHPQYTNVTPVSPASRQHSSCHLQTVVVILIISNVNTPLHTPSLPSYTMTMRGIILASTLN